MDAKLGAILDRAEKIVKVLHLQLMSLKEELIILQLLKEYLISLKSIL
jgi:hypothetical protein